MIEIDTLNDILAITAYKYREEGFQLASGAVSKVYLDVKTTLLHPTAVLHVSLCVKQAVDAFLAVDAVAGVIFGAMPLACNLGRSYIKPTLGIRAGSKEHGTGNVIEGIDNIRFPREGKPRVLLVEDVVTSGGSTINALKALSERFDVTDVVIVVDREQDGLARIKSAYPKVKVQALTTLVAVAERHAYFATRINAYTKACRQLLS